MRFSSLIVSFILPAVALSARIAVIYSVGSKSHFFAVKPAIEALAERGHRITLFTPFEGIGKGIRNVTEVVLHESFEVLEEDARQDWFANQKRGVFQLFTMITQVAKCIRIGTADTVRNSEFRRIVAENDVDLFLVDGIFNEFAYPIAEMMGVPAVAHLSAAPIPVFLSMLGGPAEYASVPAPFADFTDDMSFSQRAVNFLMSNLVLVARNFYWIPIMDKLLKEEFPRVKSVNDVAKETSISIVNSHPTSSFPRSLPPTVIPIGALHTRPALELPQHLKKFADDSKHGFIVFSLGSFVPVSTMPNETLQCFMRVFAKLPLNVVWKWEAAVPENTPPNVLMADWIPQQDLLGHPNAKLIITHGGLIGTQEAIYHGVPILALPFGNDQRGNIVKPRLDGYALQLDWDKLNDAVLFESISHLVYDPKVRESAGKASKLMRDELVPGKELAVHWIEYVLRNNGTKHLQLKAKDMPFYKLYLLDVMTLLLSVLTGFSLVLFYSVRRILRKLFAGPVKTKTS